MASMWKTETTLAGETRMQRWIDHKACIKIEWSSFTKFRAQCWPGCTSSSASSPSSSSSSSPKIVFSNHWIHQMGEAAKFCCSFWQVFWQNLMEFAWGDPPTNSGIMDFNCNFPDKIAQQPRDQNHKQFERPNLLNPKFSDVEPKYEITLGAAYLEPDQIYTGSPGKPSWCVWIHWVDCWYPWSAWLVSLGNSLIYGFFNFQFGWVLSLHYCT